MTSGTFHCGKRLFDLLAVLVLALPALLLCLILAVILAMIDGVPVIFSQQRAGLNGRPFTFYKFRTLRTDCDPYGASPKNGRDPRLTRTGAFLRKTSLDELPQLWNVLCGSMSLVGPRPLYISQMDEWNDRQKRRLEVTPGMTGLAQVSGRGSLTREQKLELDVTYVEHQSMVLDLKILWRTFTGVLCARDIYEVRYSDDQDTRGGSSPTT